MISKKWRVSGSLTFIFVLNLVLIVNLYRFAIFTYPFMKTIKGFYEI